MKTTEGLSSGVSQSTVRDESQKEEDWVKQMRELELLDSLEKMCMNALSSSPQLLDHIRRLMSKFSGIKRIPLYNIMLFLDWDEQLVGYFIGLLIKIDAALVHRFVDIMGSQIPRNLLHLFLKTFSVLKLERIEELIQSVSSNEIRTLVQILRHCTQYDQEQCAELVNSLSFRETIHMIGKCDEPLSNKCRLCKSRRLHALETRLINNQVPEGLIKSAGNFSWIPD